MSGEWRISFQDRAHFMAVDHARARRRDKPGGGAVRIDLDNVEVPAPDAHLDILDFHDALERLAAFDSRKSAIVELHVFGGLRVKTEE